MQTNTVQTLIDYVKDLTGQTNASDAKIIRALNFGVDDYSRQRILSTKRFTPDSTNHGNVARVTATATSGKVSFDDLEELVGIRRVEVFAGGSYHVVESVDVKDESEPLETLYGGTGVPRVYDIRSNTMYLHPAPSGSMSVRVEYTRNHPRFSTDNLTQDVGVLNIDDEYVAMFAADRLMIGSNDPSRTQIRNELELKKKEMQKTFANLDQDYSKRLTTRVQPQFSRNAFSRHSGRHNTYRK